MKKSERHYVELDLASIVSAKERRRLRTTLEEQAKRPPAALEAADDTIYTRDELIELVKYTVGEFLWISKDKIDLAAFAVELLEYSNGSRPMIEALPQRDELTWPKFRVTLEPESSE